MTAAPRETVTINGRTFPVVNGEATRSPKGSLPHPPLPASKPSKYRNQPVVVNGVRFASQTEAARDAELLLLERDGKISHLKRQPKFDLIVNGEKVCRYIGDWEYVDQDCEFFPQHVVEDRKGFLTKEFKIKWALAKALHPEIEWRLS